MAAAIAVKALLEAIDFALPGSRFAWAHPLLFVATAAVVVAFAGWAIWAWQRGRLRGAPPLGRGAALGTALAAAAYAALATWPLWRG